MNEKRRIDVYWKVFFAILAVVLLIFLIMELTNASKIVNFDNSLTIENLTFTGNQNITRYVNISQFSNVTNAYMNFSGFTYNSECYQETANISNLTCGSLDNGIYFTKTSGAWNNANPSLTYDSNWATGDWESMPTKSSVLYINYSKPMFASNTTTWNTNGSNGLNNYSFSSLDCWNSFEDILELSAVSDSGSNIIWRCGLTSGWQTISSTHASPYAMYEEAINWEIINAYPTNLSLNIGNISNNWYYDGNFTQSNNRTAELASYFNLALSNGSCNCQGCIKSDGNCSIPLIFHSETAGILQVSDINITYTNIPTINLSSPANNTITASIKPTFNWTYYKNIEDIRYNYSLQIANDTSFKTIVFNKSFVETENYTLSNIGGENLSNGVWYWRVNATDGTTMRYSENFTLTVNINTLSTTIYQPTGDQGSKDVSFSVIIDNSSAISSCFYYVNFSTGTYVINKNESINCNGSLITGSFLVPFETSYIFYFSANNSNATQVRAYSQSNFNVPLPPVLGGGGGGGASINPEAWTASPLMIDKYFLYLPSYNATKKTQIEIISNLKITGCFSSSSNKCEISDGNKAIITILVPNPGNYLLAEQNLSVKLMNEYGQFKEVTGKLRIINLGFYFPTNEISLTDDGFLNNPYLFAIKDNQMIGIRMYVIIIAFILIIMVLRKISR